MSQCNLTKRLTEYSSVFLQNLHDEDCLRKSLMLVLAALLRGQFLESRGNSYLNFLQPHTQLYWVKFENGRFQQSLPPRIFELRIHSPSLVRMDGRRPWWTRLREGIEKLSRTSPQNAIYLSHIVQRTTSKRLKR